MEAFYREDGMAFAPARAEAALARLIGEPALGWVTVACQHDAIVGYLAVTLGYSLEFGGQYALIDEIYIDRQQRGQGIGTGLVEGLVGECRARGLVAVRLEVERVNVEAQRFYERLGFEKHDRDLMTRRLG
jgi:ribosomal protein S18 acetylase RimI-like enzyme